MLTEKFLIFFVGIVICFKVSVALLFSGYVAVTYSCALLSQWDWILYLSIHK